MFIFSLLAQSQHMSSFYCSHISRKSAKTHSKWISQRTMELSNIFSSIDEWIQLLHLLCSQYANLYRFSLTYMLAPYECYQNKIKNSLSLMHYTDGYYGRLNAL